MLEIVAIYFIVKEFTKLARVQGESKMRYGLIGAFSYIVPAFFTAFSLTLLFGLDPESLGSLLLASLAGIAMGALVSLKIVLPRLKASHTLIDQPAEKSLLDEDMWR